MPHTIEQLLTKTYSLKKFLKKELRLKPAASEVKAIRRALRTLRQTRKELRKLQKMIEEDDTLVFRIHRRRQRFDCREFQESVEAQEKKIDRIVSIFGFSMDLRQYGMSLTPNWRFLDLDEKNAVLRAAGPRPIRLAHRNKLISGILQFSEHSENFRFYLPSICSRISVGRYFRWRYGIQVATGPLVYIDADPHSLLPSCVVEVF